MDTCDLVQEVALLTFEHLARFTPRHERAMPAYLRQIAKNRIFDEFRRAGRRPHAVALDEQTLQSSSPSPLALTLKSEENRDYARALKTLRTRERRILMARYERRCTFAAIAEEFDYPSADAARMAVRRTVNQLARHLKPA
jgi:RNA polymerase sigma factor (sigma-70 family)